MNLKAYYTKLWTDSVECFLSDRFDYDHQINSPKDDRRGVTLLARPENRVNEGITSFLTELKLIEPDQYYYPSSDIHMTVMSIISCYSGFHLEKIDIKDYVDVVLDCLKGIGGLRVHFQGICASPSSVLIQGFPENEQLEILRNVLRQNFKASQLEQSLDKRYRIQTAHLTVMRFRSTVHNPAKLTDYLAKYRSHEFGKSSMDKLELVFNDWYQRKDHTELLKRFCLPEK